MHPRTSMSRIVPIGFPSFLDVTSIHDELCKKTSEMWVCQQNALDLCAQQFFWDWILGQNVAQLSTLLVALQCLSHIRRHGYAQIPWSRPSIANHHFLNTAVFIEFFTKYVDEACDRTQRRCAINKVRMSFGYENQMTVTLVLVEMAQPVDVWEGKVQAVECRRRWRHFWPGMAASIWIS